MADEPNPTASDAPKLSIMAACGMCFSRPRLISTDHITPDDTIATTVDRSYLPGFSSSSFSIGLPKASPTIAILVTPLRSTVSHRFCGLKFLFSVRVTMVPPFSNTPIAVNRPVPCISGQAGMMRA